MIGLMDWRATLMGRKIIDYQVIYLGDSWREFRDVIPEMNEYINMGYELLGGAFMDDGSCNQTFVKYSKVGD